MQSKIANSTQSNDFIAGRILACVMAVVVLMASFGCGKGGPERAIVSGRITYDGNDVGDGEIFFLPKEGTVGSGGGSRIVRGQYRADARGGVIVGKYKVRIDGFELAEGAEPPPAVMGADATRGKPYLPVKYNISTNLELTIPHSGKFEHNFELEK